MKNKDGSTLMIVMAVFVLFAVLAAALSVLFFVNLRTRINEIEERALYIELENDVYGFLNEFDPEKEVPGYIVEIENVDDNYQIIYQIIFTNSDNQKIRAEILVSFPNGNYQILSWRKG
jgi:lipopolysaccharide export LptBFGC system permease protein LptF